MAQKDYYTILGLSKGASPEEIKSAFKKKAAELHPDRNKEPDAEKKFKEVNEAYQILSDKDKKEMYDSGGSAAPFYHSANKTRNPFNDFFQNMHFNFEDIFGSGNFSVNPNPPGNKQTETRLTIDFKDAYYGCKKQINVPINEDCTSCHGEGGELETCHTCAGKGHVLNRHPMGGIVINSTCGVCGGSGRSIKSLCRSCSGSGTIQKEKKINLTIPAGVAPGNELRVSTDGNEIRIFLKVRSQPGWIRKDNHLTTSMETTYSKLLLGTILKLKLLDGSEKEVNVPPMTMPGSELVFKKEGFTSISGEKGDLKIIINLKFPQKISEKTRNLLMDLEKEE